MPITFAYLEEPPFCAPSTPGSSAGVPIGCDVEVAFAIFAAMGAGPIETRLVTFADLLPGVAAGHWDINTPLFITAERAQLVDFSRPAWSLSDGLLMRVDDPCPLTSYETLAASDARLVVVADQVQEQRALAAGTAPARIHRVATQAKAVDVVRDRRADAYASVTMAHRGHLLAHPDPALRVVDFGAHGGASALGAYSFAKSAGDLRRAFDAAL